MRFGDVEAGFAGADHVLEQSYQSSPIEHAPTETTGCVVAPEGNDRFTCYTNTQAMFFTLDNASIICRCPATNCISSAGTVGGGFGGKVDVIVEPIAILGAKLTGRPVSFIYSREEEMQISSPARRRKGRHQGRRHEGRPHRRPQSPAIRCRRLFAPLALWRAEGAGHYPGPYTIPNVWIEPIASTPTARPPPLCAASASPSATSRWRCRWTSMARLIGMDPLEFRFINAYRDGDMKAHRQPTEGAALIECMQEASRAANWPVAEKYMAMSSYAKGA